MDCETPPGREARTRRFESHAESPDDGGCVVCGAPADGIHAPSRAAVCRRCVVAGLVPVTPDDDPDGRDGALLCDGGAAIEAGPPLADLLDEYGPAEVGTGNYGRPRRLHFPDDDGEPCPQIEKNAGTREVASVAEAPLRARICECCDPRDGGEA